MTAKCEDVRTGVLNAVRVEEFTLEHEVECFTRFAQYFVDSGEIFLCIV